MKKAYIKKKGSIKKLKKLWWIPILGSIILFVLVQLFFESILENSDKIIILTIFSVIIIGFFSWFMIRQLMWNNINGYIYKVKKRRLEHHVDKCLESINNNDLSKAKIIFNKCLYTNYHEGNASLIEYVKIKYDNKKLKNE